MTNKVIRQASKCANCVAEKSKILKQKINKKTDCGKIDHNFFYMLNTVIIKHVVKLFNVVIKMCCMKQLRFKKK